ncbi:MAG: hypothetical protein M3R02_26785 [Chloroflexota bacterium]|nr:hypothetical protein [Chloroflexota bacterium]
MHATLDTYAAALEVDRKLTLKRTERRALLLESGKRSRVAPAGDAAGRTIVRGFGLARSIRSLRGRLQPVHA